MWNENTKPTRANVEKRIYAAEEALEAALVLVDKMPADQNLKPAINNALGWIGNTRLRLQKNKGKRSAAHA